jgi:hypothetical protein
MAILTQLANFSGGSNSIVTLEYRCESFRMSGSGAQLGTATLVPLNAEPGGA